MQDTIKNTNSGRRDLLRFNTAGSVDNGKSTLIGRLLFDTGGIPEDIIANIAARGAEYAHAGNLNLAAFTDGLRAERDKGITIDASYRYFSRGQRDFIVADTPGHFEYTHNMLTATSHSDLTLILVDATKGIVEQNKRHAYVAALAGVTRLVILVNKMDLVDYSERRFDQLHSEFSQLLDKLPGVSATFVPISALHGDNVVTHSKKLPWYRGPSILSLLESAQPETREAVKDLRFIVQWVKGSKARGTSRKEVAGILTSGSLASGDTVKALPSMQTFLLNNITGLRSRREIAHAPTALRALVDPRAKVARGDLLVNPDKSLQLSRSVHAEICWIGPQRLRPGNRLLFQARSRVLEVTVPTITSRINIAHYDFVPGSDTLRANDIAQVKIDSKESIVVDRANLCSIANRFTLIDPRSKRTVAAGRILAKQ